MASVERRDRQRAEREHRIVATARRIAEAEGWCAVTIRRLAEEIEHSQPVLYTHFANRDAIVAAVAVDGFLELATVLWTAARGRPDRHGALEAVATAYLAFARNHAALYDAMFTMPTSLRFASEETRPELRGAFAALAAVVASPRTPVEVATEAFWAALHGLAALEQSGRIRPSARDARVALVVRALTDA